MAENQQPRGRAHSCCGNGGPGKSWKCPNPTFPRFPPPLEIPHKPRDSHIPTAPATADRFHTQERNPPKSRDSTDSRSEPVFHGDHERLLPERYILYLLQSAILLDKDPSRAVDHHLADRVIQ